MTIAELIRTLSMQPPDLPVIVSNGAGDYVQVTPPEEVMIHEKYGSYYRCQMAPCWLCNDKTYRKVQVVIL